MRAKIVTGFAAAVLLGSLSPAIVVADKLGPAAHVTPLPKFQLAACRFWQCNCHSECVVYDGDRCVRSIRTCDTCSKCDD